MCFSFSYGDMEVTPHGQAEDAHVPAEQLKLGRAASLRELEQDFVFYSLAIPEGFCPLPEHPHVTLQREHFPDFTPYMLSFDRAIFSGFGPHHNRTLYAIDKTRWETLANLLRGITLVDRPRRLMMQLRLKEIQVLDPLEWQRRRFPTPNGTKLQVACLETNQGCYYVEAEDWLRNPPQLRYTADTFPDFVQQAERLLGPS